MDKNVLKNLSILFENNKSNIYELWYMRVEKGLKIIIELVGEKNIKEKMANFIDLFIKSVKSSESVENYKYIDTNEILYDISRELTINNVTPTETATFILILKESIIPIIKENVKEITTQLEYIMIIDKLIDKIGIYTFEIYLESREKVIKEQQQALIDVSIPVVKIWDNIIMIPLIGMLDSERTKLMMETLLSEIEKTQSKVAILDISGIPIVDTLVARHLLMTISATKLMGSECIITGISAKISQTIVQLGVDLSEVITKNTLSDGLKLALEMMSQKIK